MNIPESNISLLKWIKGQHKLQGANYILATKLFAYKDDRLAIYMCNAKLVKNVLYKNYIN